MLARNWLLLYPITQKVKINHTHNDQQIVESNMKKIEMLHRFILIIRSDIY